MMLYMCLCRDTIMPNAVQGRVPENTRGLAARLLKCIKGDF